MMKPDKVKMKNSLPIGISDRYLVKKRIGDGGMGYVYLAEDMHLMRQVAIKTIRPELIQNDDVQKRIERECKLHAAIRIHPHIVALYDRVVDSHKNVSLIMEYVEGETLLECIATAKQNTQDLPIELIVAIILQVLDALGCIHRHGIIHRDIKPSNIIVGGLESGVPYAKLMDFGIARDVSEDDSLTRLTMIGVGGPGTPAYMAPERIDSKTYGDICPATDLYSVGIILYELFYKEPPFQGTLTEVLSGHLARVPTFSSFSLIPEGIRNVIVKALEKNPAERYSNAQQFAVALKAAGQACGNETLAVTSFDYSSSPCKTVLDIGYSLLPDVSPLLRIKKKNIIWCASVLGLIVVVVVVYFYSSKDFFIIDGISTLTPKNIADEQLTKQLHGIIESDNMSADLTRTNLDSDRLIQQQGNKELNPLVEDKEAEQDAQKDKKTSLSVKNEGVELRKNAAIKAFDGARKNKQQPESQNSEKNLSNTEEDVRSHAEKTESKPIVKPVPNLTPKPKVAQKVSPMKRSGDFVEVPYR